MSKCLYRVVCRGMTSGFQMPHGIAYVVTSGGPNKAYAILREHLDRRGLGFELEREMDRVELLAEDVAYPPCEMRLFVEAGNE